MDRKTIKYKIMKSINREGALKIIDKVADKTLSPGCKIVTGKDRRMNQYSSPNNKKLDRGKIVGPAVGTIISISNEQRKIPYTKKRNPSFFWCTSPDNVAPWRTPDDKPEKILGHPVTYGRVVELLKQKMKFQYGDLLLHEEYVSAIGAKYRWEFWFNHEKLVLDKLWKPFGYDVSLQDIVEHAPVIQKACLCANKECEELTGELSQPVSLLLNFINDLRL